MYRAAMGELVLAENGQVAMSFRDAQRWGEYGAGKGLVLLMGDDTAGPFVFFSCFEPMEDEMPRGFAHGHDSDNWRISVQGTTNMGKYAYTQSQFRFQDGGVPYPGDNVAWGPKGGYGIVMFADRRGWPIRPVDEKLAEQMEGGQKAYSEQIGVEVLHPCPGAPAIRTTLGETTHGHLDSGFDTAEAWPEIVPGTRAALSVMGERTVGPVLVLLRSDPGALVVPGGTLGTEALHVVADGTGVVAGVTKTLGDFWLAEAGMQQPEVVAGPNGMSHVLVIGDRRALPEFDVGEDNRAWQNAVESVANDLGAQL